MLKRLEMPFHVLKKKAGTFCFVKALVPPWGWALGRGLNGGRALAYDFGGVSCPGVGSGLVETESL
jgi:hypothetical protein